MLKYNHSRVKNGGTYRERGGERRARYVTPDLIYSWEGVREYISARTINGMENKKCVERTLSQSETHPGIRNVCTVLYCSVYRTACTVCTESTGHQV